MSLKGNRRKRCGPVKCNQMIFDTYGHYQIRSDAQVTFYGRNPIYYR